MIAFIYMFLLLLPVLDGMRDGETLATNSRNYHFLGWLVRAATATLLLWDNPWLLLPYAAYFWIVFDATWNIAAHRSIFYVGKTAFLDSKLGKKIYAAKLLLLCLTLVFLIFKNKIL